LRKKKHRKRWGRPYRFDSGNPIEIKVKIVVVDEASGEEG